MLIAAYLATAMALEISTMVVATGAEETGMAMATATETVALTSATTVEATGVVAMATATPTVMETAMVLMYNFVKELAKTRPTLQTSAIGVGRALMHLVKH